MITSDCMPVVLGTGLNGVFTTNTPCGELMYCGSLKKGIALSSTGRTAYSGDVSGPSLILVLGCGFHLGLSSPGAKPV